MVKSVEQPVGFFYERLHGNGSANDAEIYEKMLILEK
jgi:hypothetical protein